MSKQLEILMTTSNGEAYLRDQLDSILAQSDSRWHLTVSDDGSTDDTLEILAYYVRQWPEKIVRARSGKRFGNARDHFMFLLRQCAADYVLFCDQDDVWHPDKVKKLRAALEKGEREYGADTPLLVFSDQTPADAKLNPLAPSLMRWQKQYFEAFDYRSILMQNVVTGGAMAVNHALADLAGQCQDDSQAILHDWWTAAVAARFGKIVYIDEPLGLYRQHGHNEVGAKNTHSAAYLKRQLGRLPAIRAAMLDKKRQAAMFQATYADRLTPEDRAFLDGFRQSRSGWGFYWKYRRLIHSKLRMAMMLFMG